MGKSLCTSQTIKRKIEKWSFCGGHNPINMVTYQNKIVVPQKLQKYVIHWCHTFLLHYGLDRTEAMIRQHLFWTGIREAVRNEFKNCDSCQCNKKVNKKMVKYALSWWTKHRGTNSV